MMELMRTGGYSMWIVLILGTVLLVAAILFARRPENGTPGFIRGMSLAMVFAILAGIASNLAATFSNAGAVADAEGQGLTAAAHAMAGLGESMGPGILGFTLLSLTWVITAIGIRRVAAPVMIRADHDGLHRSTALHG